MHKPPILVGTIGRSVPAEPNPGPAAAQLAAHPALPGADEKAFFDTLRAKYAHAGLEPTSEAGIDGRIRPRTFPHGRIVPLDDLEQACAFLAAQRECS